MRSELTHWLGEMPATEVCRQDVDTVYVREYQNFTEKKIIYFGYEDDPIPAYLLIPRVAERPLPGVVAFHQCGCHCDIGKEQVVGKRVDLPDQAYGFELVNLGFAVLAPDASNVGERYRPALREPWECACDRASQDACCCGPGGSWGHPRWRPVFDAKRACDILAAQPEVDPSRIGAVGHSLGADTIIWALPFEPRLKAVAFSGGGIMKAKNEGWMPYALPYEVLLSEVIAPQVPLFEFAGVQDPIHRIDAPLLDDPRMHMQKKRDVYASLKAQGYPVALHTEDCGHYFHEKGRALAYEFLHHHLAHRTG